MRAERKITIQDIANELGITKGTVDRAIHNRPGINPDTRERILELIKQYDYRPDKAARSLSLRTKKIRIGLIYERECNFFWDSVEKGVKAAESELGDFGLEVVYRRCDEERNVNDIIRFMDELVEQKVDAIAMVPVNEPCVKEKIDYTVESGLPVVTLNDDIVDSKRVFYVGPQIRQSGRIAGELMGRFLKKEGKVFTISLELPSFEYNERLEGFKEVIRDEYKNIELIGNFSYGYKKMSSNGMNTLKSILENIDEIDGIYDITGGYLYDVANILKSVKKHQNAILIGHEISSKVKELIADGTIKACISQDPYSQGYFIIKMLFDYLVDGKRPEFERMYTRLDIIMKENMISQKNIINPYYLS